MNCKYHPDVEATVHCQVCNTPLCHDCIANGNSAAPQCERCISFDGLAEIGEKTVSDAEKRRKKIASSQKTKKRINWKVVQIIIILIALLFVPVQYFRMSGYQVALPLEKTDTVEMTNLCIATLLRISRLLQHDRLPGDEYRCPLSNHAYIVTHEENDIIVSDPNPGLHGFTVFRVSRNYPDPVFRK